MVATPLTAKGTATRAALMRAALQLFVEKGFLRTQVGEIVRLAGKSNGVFHIYFKNKDALLDACLAECDSMVPWSHAETSLLFEKARHFLLQSYWSVYERYGPALEALEEAALVSDHFESYLGELRCRREAGMARMIRTAQSEGSCRGIDPELTAHALGAVISDTTAYWFKHRAALQARGFGKEAALSNLETLFNRMLHGDAKAVPDQDCVAPENVRPRRA